MVYPFLLHSSFPFNTETQRHNFNVYSFGIGFEYFKGDDSHHWPLGITASLYLLELNEAVFVPKILLLNVIEGVSSFEATVWLPEEK